MSATKTTSSLTNDSLSANEQHLFRGSPHVFVHEDDLAAELIGEDANQFIYMGLYNLYTGIDPGRDNGRVERELGGPALRKRDRLKRLELAKEGTVTRTLRPVLARFPEVDPSFISGMPLMASQRARSNFTLNRPSTQTDWNGVTLIEHFAHGPSNDTEYISYWIPIETVRAHSTGDGHLRYVTRGHMHSHPKWRIRYDVLYNSALSQASSDESLDDETRQCLREGLNLQSLPVHEPHWQRVFSAQLASEPDARDDHASSSSMRLAVAGDRHVKKEEETEVKMEDLSAYPSGSGTISGGIVKSEEHQALIELKIASLYKWVDGATERPFDRLVGDRYYSDFTPDEGIQNDYFNRAAGQ